MAAPVVIFDGVWKKFQRGERHDSLRDLIPSLVGRMTRKQAAETLQGKEFWALRNVGFAVEPGGALGIIGPNGAGKSTTLKLLTKILRPTKGHCEVRGRVGALIEVAAGFHPDLTGRENVYLQGAIMGMRRDEIARKLDAIVDFSGVADFIDTPVKRYSSGMNARLGFSIAAHLEPDVLIIDEVLSVGDMVFQQKCLDRMLEFRSKGTAIVFVSHHLNSVVQLCQSAVLLRNEIIATGDATSVVHRYLDETMSGALSAEAETQVRIRASLRPAAGGDLDACEPGTPLVLDVDATALVDLPSEIVFGFLCHRADDDLVVYDVNFGAHEVGWKGLKAGESVSLTFAFTCNLTRGSYRIGMHMYDARKNTFPIRAPKLAAIKVLESRTFAGVSYLDARLALR